MLMKGLMAIWLIVGFVVALQIVVDSFLWFDIVNCSSADCGFFFQECCGLFFVNCHAELLVGLCIVADCGCLHLSYVVLCRH